MRILLIVLIVFLCAILLHLSDTTPKVVFALVLSARSIWECVTMFLPVEGK